ncbi:MAG TPA: ABC transporter permease [Gemmatimonadales bacterium]|nr:ABC transporter permease [Gemmatimonadales bacterium]
MRKVWAVVRREFVERIRSRWFWISAVLGPVFFGAIIIIPLRLAASGGAKRIVVVDGTNTGFGARVADTLMRGRTFWIVARTPPRAGLLDSLTSEVGANRLHGFLIVSDTTVEGGAAEYRASNISSFRDIDELRGVLGRLAVNARLERAGVDPRTVSRAQISVNLATKKISGFKTTGESSAQSFWLAYVMSIVLFVVIAVYGVNVMSSVLEEKTTRIVEVLVSSLKPFQLMLGKVVGVGAVSIFQFVIWGVGGRLVLTQRAALLGNLGPEDAATQQVALQLPHVAATTVAVFLAYFLGGFFLYSAMFAAVGAMSSNEQEARQAQQPVMFLLMIAYLSVFALANDPGSGYAVALSLIPFTAPIAMPVRWAAGSVGPNELVASLVLLVLGIVVVTWVAARIYRVGILMTGKRPSLGEIVRWVRAG